MPYLKTTSSIEWYYEAEGNGDALLFIHGWGVDRRIWRQQLKHFVNGYKVISIDLPGHGKSTWRNVSFTKMSEDINEILEKENIEKVSIVGSSIGGLFALKFHKEFPGKVKRMIFVGSMPKFAKTKEYPYGLDLTEIKKLSGQVVNAYPAIIDIFFRSLFTKEERSTRRYKWLQKFKRYDVKPVQDALIEYLKIIENEDLREDLSKVTIPMQFINGKQDNICSEQTVEFIKTLVGKNARFDFFEKCGHFPFLSMAYDFNDVMEDFLKQTDSGKDNDKK